MGKETRLSIRQIQSLLKENPSSKGGEVLSSSLSGSWCGIWYDWFCEDSSLKGRASKFISFINRLEGDYIDTHYVWLKNNCPMRGNLYDDIRISPILEEENEIVKFDPNKHRVQSYNIGYSLGNKTNRAREVFDTRPRELIRYEVDSNKEAAEVVNKLLTEGINALISSTIS